MESLEGVAEPRPQGSAERVALVPRSWLRSLPVAARFSLRCYMLSILKSRTRSAPPNGSGTGPRRVPFCASSSEQLDGSLRLAFARVIDQIERSNGFHLPRVPEEQAASRRLVDRPIVQCDVRDGFINAGGNLFLDAA